MKILFVILATFVLVTNSLAADADLKSIHKLLFGDDPLKPSEQSLIYQYLKETSAQTVVRKFPKGPENSPVGKLSGVDKLVVAVSPETFSAFRKYFSTKNLFYAISLINDSHIQIAHKGKAMLYSPPLKDKLHFTKDGMMMIPVLLDDNEASRLETYMGVIESTGLDWKRRDKYFYPENIETISGRRFFPIAPFWESCAAWFATLPIGNQLVDTYYFPAKNEQSEITAHKLEDFEIEDAYTDRLLHKIWKVPGHQQLGDMLDRAALGRGEFHNGGWIVYELLGSIGNDRTPVVFLQVNDETKEIKPDFPLNINAQFIGD